MISPLSLTLSVQYKTCKDGSVLGVTVMRIAMLTHCQALTQSCSYTEGNTHVLHFGFFSLILKLRRAVFTMMCCFCRPAAETIVNVLDFKKEVGLWHAILTVRQTHI